jgi:hypothetical protein
MRLLLQVMSKEVARRHALMLNFPADDRQVGPFLSTVQIGLLIETVRLS